MFPTKKKEPDQFTAKKKYDDESGISDWNINLYELGDGIGDLIFSTSTSQGGEYSFDDVPYGTYLVCEENRGGWTQTSPATSGNGVYACENGTTGHVVDIGPENSQSENNDFMNKKGEVNGERPGLLTCTADRQEITYIDVSDDSESKIYGLDTNGNANIKQTFSGDFHSVLGADSNEVLYGIENTGGDGTVGDEPLVKFNPDGSTTTVGSTGLPKPVAMNFAPTGELYMADQQNDEFYEINPTSATSSQLAPFSQDKDIDGGDLVVDENNQLTYLHRLGYVFQLDLDTGDWEQLKVENTANDQRLDGDFTSLAYLSGTYYALDKENNEIDKFEIYNSNTTTAEDEVAYKSSSDVSNTSVDFGDATSCLEPPAQEPTGTISGMKFEDDPQFGEKNDGEEGLEGWEIVAFGEENLVDTVTVEADDASGATTTALQTGNRYLIEVEGRYAFADNNDEFDGDEQRIADAEYFSNDGGNTWSKTTTDKNGNGLDLLINGSAVDWGARSSSHLYRIIDEASSGSANFRIWDQPYDDNTGELTVRIYNVSNYSDTTDENGNYSIEAPLGEYTVTEVLQNGFEQTYPDGGEHTADLNEDGQEIDDLHFGNDNLEEEDDQSDEENPNPEEGGESGGGGGGALSSGGGSDDGGDDGDDDGSVLGRATSTEDTNDGGSDFGSLLGDLAEALRGLQDSLGGDGAVAGAQYPDWPNTGDGSLVGPSK